MKRLLSVSGVENENVNKKAKHNKIKLSEREFILHAPSWAGDFFDDAIKKSISFTNTCTIDYFLFALWTAWRLTSFPMPEFEFGTDELSKNILDIIESIEKNCF